MGRSFRQERAGTYFRALTAYRAGDPREIVEQVAHAAIAAAWTLADALFARPVIDVRAAAELTGGSERAALNAIDSLVEAGVLAPITSARRGRVWQAQDVLDAAEAFVRRAGRRSIGR